MLIFNGRRYLPDHVFWSWLGGKISEGAIYSPRQVYKEILEGTDFLKQWIQQRTSCMNLPTEKHIQEKYKLIAAHVKKTYSVAWMEEFLSGGDAWVIACAMERGGTVITEESKSRTEKIRIPVICQEFAKVRCENTDAFLLALNAPFLGQARIENGKLRKRRVI